MQRPERLGFGFFRRAGLESSALLARVGIDGEREELFRQGTDIDRVACKCFGAVGALGVEMDFARPMEACLLYTSDAADD